jgi:hypothetical protein
LPAEIKRKFGLEILMQLFAEDVGAIFSEKIVYDLILWF